MAKEFTGVQGKGNMQALPWGSQGSYNVLSPYVVYVLANTLWVMTVSGGTDILTPQENTRFATKILCNG